MIVLSVTSYNGAPVGIAPVSFDELGGTIGRATTNQLVLPDPDRTISRVHAHVVFKSGRYMLIDKGSNAVLHNGLPIGGGREVSLAGGDEIQIGGYLISASTGVPVTAKDPFSNFALDSAVFQSTSGNDAIGNLSAPPSSLASATPAKTVGATLPDDWDPFKLDSPPANSFEGLDEPISGGLVSSPLGVTKHGGSGVDPLAAARQTEGSLDSLFGLGGAGDGKDPLAGSSFMAPKPQFDIPDDQGILQALQQPAPGSSKTLHDHDSDLNAPWQDTKPRAKTLPLQSVKPNTDKPAQDSMSDPGVLVKAFLEGLGAPNLRLRSVDAEAMLQLGKLVRASMSGTVDLLSARTAMKKEVRAEVTVMSAVANNPLKFSPNVDFALQYLLGAQTPGFMAPVEAVQDAFHDLRAHQIGVMAGMRTALANVLKRLDPSALEGKLAPQSGMASLIPSNRKAQLWDQFQALYGRLFNESEDGFEELFVNAFVKEYERYVAQLDAGNP